MPGWVHRRHSILQASLPSSVSGQRQQLPGQSCARGRHQSGQDTHCRHLLREVILTTRTVRALVTMTPNRSS